MHRCIDVVQWVQVQAELTKVQGELAQVKKQKVDVQQQIVVAKKGKEDTVRSWWGAGRGHVRL